MEMVAASKLRRAQARVENSRPYFGILYDTICKIVDLEREINEDIDRLVDLKAEARRVINAVSDPDQQLILELRYLCYKPWNEIMTELGYSEPTIYRLHGEALKKICVPVKNDSF